MNSTIQPGMHPDAESLTAFAEQLLPGGERDEILAHMSTCGRCREVVFLARQAAESDQQSPVAPAELRRKQRLSWFNWSWAWIPAAACAGLIGVAVMLHYRKSAPETQTAANGSPTDALQTADARKAVGQNSVAQSLAQNEPKQTRSAKPGGIVAERETLPSTIKRDEAKRLDEKSLADQKDMAVGAAAPPMALAPGFAGGSIHGTLGARAKTAIGGPSPANQFQQQNMANQQNELQSQTSEQFSAANKTANAATAPRAESETVTVNAEPVAPAPSAPVTAGLAQAQASASAQLKSTPATDKAYAPGYLAGVSKKQKASLPSGLDTLSVASGASRTLALDTKGALFLSEDGGKHWKPVRMQWTGRAVLVRSLTAPQESSELKALDASPTARFELVTDGLQTWLSADGNIWTLKAMPGK